MHIHEDICLIRPPAVSFQFDLSITYPAPIGIAYLCAYLKQNKLTPYVIDAIGEDPTGRSRFGEKVVLHGLSLEGCVEKIHADTTVVGITVPFSMHWPSAKSMIRQIRAKFPKMLIVIGGEHSTAMPEFSLNDCPELDICVLGEGEATLVDLLLSRKEGRSLDDVSGIMFRKDGVPFSPGRRPRMKQMDSIPWPDWSSFPLASYHQYKLSYGVAQGVNMPIMASRGCPYLCTFCSSPQMWGTNWTIRSVDDVIAEIKDLMHKYGATDFSFYDLTAIVQKKWVVEFCNRLIEEKLDFITWQLPSGTRSEALDKEVCDLLYKTGCRYLVYAPESASPNTLKAIKKRINLDKLYESMAYAIKIGITVRFNIVIGFPSEHRMDIFRTLLFVLKMSIVGATDVFVNIYSPYPGSELFREMESSGKIGKLDDEYFHSLEPNNVFSVPVKSTNDRINIVELVIYRTLGYAMFYIGTYLFKPGRIFKTLKNLRDGKTSSAFENFLRKLLHSVFPGMKKA